MATFEQTTQLDRGARDLAAARGELLPSPGGAAALLPSPAAAPVRRAA